MSEKKFEPCTLEEATHVEMGGKVHKLGEDGFTSAHRVFKYSKHNIEVHTADAGWQLIHVGSFPTLGIKPMRKKKQEPIEFEHIFTFEEITLGIIPCEAEGKRFRCVQIVEED